MRKSTVIAVCSVSTALSVLILFIGSVTSILSYAAGMFTGLIMIMLKRTISAKSAWLTYAATVILSFILTADRECSLMYAVFFGYYPIVREAFLKIRRTALRLICEFFLFNAAMVVCQLALIYIFGIPFLEEGQGVGFIIAFFALLNVLFAIYRMLVSKIDLLYTLRLEKKIKKILK